MYMWTACNQHMWGCTVFSVHLTFPNKRLLLRVSHAWSTNLPQSSCIEKSDWNRNNLNMMQDTHLGIITSCSFVLFSATEGKMLQLWAKGNRTLMTNRAQAALTYRGGKLKMRSLQIWRATKPFWPSLVLTSWRRRHWTRRGDIFWKAMQRCHVMF